MFAPEHDLLLLTQALDLSRSGTFVSAGRSLPEGTQVSLEFQDVGRTIRIDATVVRTALSGRRGLGLAFLDGDASARLEPLIERLGPLPDWSEALPVGA